MLSQGVGDRHRAVVPPRAANGDVQSALPFLHKLGKQKINHAGQPLHELLGLGIAEHIVPHPGVTAPHHLRTRRIGSNYAIEVHVRMDGQMTLEEAHRTATAIENRLKREFGSRTYINIHVEPVK